MLIRGRYGKLWTAVALCFAIVVLLCFSDVRDAISRLDRSISESLSPAVGFSGLFDVVLVLFASPVFN
ncbi:MAG: hypothetical protein K1X53_02580, partial [Candidatus Sumerlaeaceae bacterium]|nr:hypothetical protein [Candidatus Sumerlaeaceae bacterium]